MGKYVASLWGHVDDVWDLVFSPDGKGLLSAAWDKMVIHWDVSWLKPTYDRQNDDVSTPNSTGGLKEISRFVGHTVR